MANLAKFGVAITDGVTAPSRRMARSADLLAKSLRNVEREVDRLNKKKEKDRKAPSPYKGLGGQLASIATGAAVAGAALTYYVGNKLYELADVAGRSSLAFKNMFGNATAGNAQLEQSVKLANLFGFGIADTIAQVQRFNSLGFSSDQSTELVKMGGDMRALGNSAEQIQRVFLQLGQIRSKGKLQGEELIVLAENGVNLGMVYERLGKRLGKPVEEIKKLQAAGELKSSDALNSIAETILITLGKTKLGQAGEEAANNTIGGLVGLIGTRLETGLFEAAKKGEPGLVRGFKAILDGIESIGGTSGGTFLEDTLGAVSDILAAIGPQIPDIVSGFKEAFGAASGFNGASIGALANELPGMARDVGSLAGSIVSLANAALPLLKLMAYVAEIPGKVGRDIGNGVADFVGLPKEANPLDDITPTDAPGWKDWKDNRKAQLELAGIEHGQAYGLGLASGMSETNAAEAAGRNMARSVDSAARDESETHSPSNMTREIGQDMGAGLAFGMYDSEDAVIGSARHMSGSAIDSTAQALRSQSNNYGAMASAAAEGITNNRQRSSVSIGDIHVHISGTGDPKDAGRSVIESIESELGALLSRHAQGVGAT